MNQSPKTPLDTVPVDEDLAEQAHPGQGIPSQDPVSKAQFPMEPGEAEREANSVLTGGGMVAGAATGAGIGVAIGGPVGVVVGGTVGAVVGALGGAAAGTLANSDDAASADTLPPAYGAGVLPATQPAKKVDKPD